MRRKRAAPRPRGPFPLRPVLLLAAIVVVIRLAARHPSRFFPVTPELLGAALFLYAPLFRYRRRGVPSWTGLGDPKRNALLLAALGAGGAAVFFLGTALGILPVPSAAGTATPPLGAFLLRQAALVALPEEVFFRGYLYDAFEEAGLEPVTASSLLFAAGHLVIHASVYRALTFFPALAFGWSRKKSGTIYVPALLHLLFNLFPYFRAIGG